MQIDFGPNAEINEQRRQPQAVRVPFIQEPIGLGDAITKATKAMHIPGCAPCRKRAEALNRKFTLSPWET